MTISRIRLALGFTLCVFASSVASAGVMELGASYGMHTSSIDKDDYTKSESLTGSVAWYFLEMSAIELSYTEGLGTQSILIPGDPSPDIYYQKVEMLGLDLIYSFGSRDSLLQPFVRAGGAHLFKKLYRQLYNGEVDQYGDTVNAIVPSWGVGLNIHLTAAFAIKGSYDEWESGVSGQSGIWDSAYRIGVSWFF